ncbi:MAG: BatD family protein [Bacteroidales bacterium]|nr:BatD family protein [Bacteroidales bacterium]
MKRSAIIFLLLTASLAAFAQNSIKVQVPNVVAADEQFNISFIIEGENAPSDFKWSEGDDFQLVWGPQKGTSTSITVVNGKRTRSVQHTYTYVLIPRKTGNLVIPSATATVKGDQIASARTTVEVVSDGASQGSAGGSSQSQGSSSGSSAGQSSSRASSTGEIARDDLFLRLSLSRTNVVVGEPITATLKLYQRVNIAGFEDAKFPTFNGFWSQEVLAPTTIDFKRESYNNMIYNTAVLRSYVLIPQQAGDITIDPAELVCLVNVRAPSSGSNSIFDSFFQEDYRTIRKRVTSESYKVHVSKLPSGAPASFGGGVGSFTIKTALSKDSLRTHDAASLMVTISGKGNVSLLEAPKIDFPPDFEVYDVKVTDNTDSSTGRTTGSKTFEYPFIPRSHGTFTLGPIEYGYYDIDAGRYATLRTDPITVKVARGNDADAPQAGQMVQGTVRRDVKSLGSDIRFIATKRPSLSRQGSFFVFSGGFWALLALLLAAAAAAYLLLKRRAARRADVVGTRGRAATKMAQKRLSVAEGYLKNNLYTAFYEELHRALLGFVSDKLNIDTADMTKENIASALSSGGVPESLVSEFTGLLDACEYARYAPDAGHEAMNAHYETAVGVISMIDSNMKKKNASATRTVVTGMMLALLLPAWNASAQSSADSLWNAGTAAYSEGKWDVAAEAWTAIEAQGLESPELYYNIGNAFFKSSDYAHAILYYERALKLDPSYSDARFNLEFAQGSVQDRIESVPEFFLKTWVRKLGYVFSSDVWTALFFVFLAIALACVLLFLLGSGSAGRKAGFFAGIAALLLAFCCLGFAASQKAAYNRADGAVVTVPVSSVKSSPGAESAKDLFILHEGTRVTVLDEVGGWWNVELADGRQGWIPASDLELI